MKKSQRSGALQGLKSTDEFDRFLSEIERFWSHIDPSAEHIIEESYWSKEMKDMDVKSRIEALKL